MLQAPCNLDCHCCCVQGLRGQHEPGRLQELTPHYLCFVASLEAEGKVARINAYGEPTLVPGIWELLAGLAPLAKVMLATNLQFRPERLFEALPPERTLFLLSSLHPETERRFDDFVDRCRLLMDRGYPLYVHYMVDDGRVDSAREHEGRMRELGIPFFLSPMQGRVGGRDLPRELSPATRDFLGGGLPSSGETARRLRPPATEDTLVRRDRRTPTQPQRAAPADPGPDPSAQEERDPYALCSSMASSRPITAGAAG